MSFFEFPHARTYDSDLGWLIRHVKSNIDHLTILQSWATLHEEEYNNLKDIVEGLQNSLVDVIVPWDSSVAYKIYSIVEYEGTNYIALKDVPVGVMITNEEYWQPANTVIEQINAIGNVVDGAMMQDNYRIFNVVDYGAVGGTEYTAEASAADTAGTKAAIDAITAAGGGVLYFPRGNYYITETLTLPPATEVTGAGGASNIIGSGLTDWIFNIPNTSMRCSIHDLMINGGGAAKGIYDCSERYYGVRTKIYNLWMKNLVCGIRASGMGSEIYNILCDGCDDYSNLTNQDSFGFLIDGTDTFISNVRVQIFYYGVIITGANNRLINVKTSVNYTGAHFNPGNNTTGILDSQENSADNFIFDNTTNSIIIFKSECAGSASQFSDFADMTAASLRMTGCSDIIMMGAISARAILGSGSCGNEKYAITLQSCTNINAKIAYTNRIYSSNVGITAPLLEYDNSYNDIQVNCEERKVYANTTFTGFTPIGGAANATITKQNNQILTTPASTVSKLDRTLWLFRVNLTNKTSAVKLRIKTGTSSIARIGLRWVATDNSVIFSLNKTFLKWVDYYDSDNVQNCVIDYKGTDYYNTVIADIIAETGKTPQMDTVQIIVIGAFVSDNCVFDLDTRDVYSGNVINDMTVSEALVALDEAQQ